MSKYKKEDDLDDIYSDLSDNEEDVKETPKQV